MRNPITPSPDRPFPLPDCILQDGWWLVEQRRPERQADLRVIAGARDEGRIERHHSWTSREQRLEDYLRANPRFASLPPEAKNTATSPRE